MASAAALKREIEARLADRIPSALSPLAQQTPRLLPTGNQALDSLLSGGLPLGSICELTGRPGSGLTSFALTALAAAATDTACAYLDVGDTLSPHAAAAAGVSLSNMLWVRFAEDIRKDTVRQRTDKAGPTFAPVDNRQKQQQLAKQNYGSTHPRSETKALAPALEQMLAVSAQRRLRKAEGTPGYPNQPLGLHTASKEQVDWERFNIRRIDGTDPLRQMDQAAAATAHERAAATLQATASPTIRCGGGWNRLDGALRATDQILQAGGFCIIVLDLASLPPEQVSRVPAATWWRFQKAAQKSDSILLLLTPSPCARSSAACVLECSPVSRPVFNGTLMKVVHNVEVARQRTASAFGKKAPGRATVWASAPAWMRAAESAGA